MRQILLSISVLIATTGLGRAECSAHSGADHPHLVELYTSEGCNSCPPAEKWLSSMQSHADLIALEFHVDYWDDLGWHDPFSAHAYTLRQQALAKRGNRDQVYTPQIWLDGQVWQNWPKGAPPSLATAASAPLTVHVSGTDVLHVTVDGAAGGDASNYRVYAALSENGLSTNVGAGENRGKRLAHDGVVRAFAGPLAPPRATADLKVPEHIDLRHAAVVAFVQDEKTGGIVQAARVPLTECIK